MDDIIVTGNSPSYIDDLVLQLRSSFDMTNLGCLCYFCGLEITQSVHGIVVNQSKYANDLLHRFGMAAAKPCLTLIALRSSKDVYAPCPPEDASHYRSIIGDLHYLTFTRLDIAFSVSKLSQYMHSPTYDDFSAAKWILRYLNGSLSSGLLLKNDSSSTISLSAFSDSDWAEDSVDWRSTIDFLVFLGPSLISWVAKKQSTAS